MNVLSQRIAAGDWQNVAKITGMSVAGAQSMFCPATTPAVIPPVPTEEELIAAAHEVELQAARRERFRRATRRQRERQARATQEKTDWVALLEKRLWALGWARANLAAELGMNLRNLSSGLAPTGHLSIARREKIESILSTAKPAFEAERCDD